MKEPPGARILILASQAEAAERWADVLRESGMEVSLAPDETRQTAAQMPEVIVTDGSVAFQDEVASGMVGVVRIGAEGPADVALTRDAPPGELRLACRLLAEIVRLRRRQDSEAEHRRRLSEEALSDPLTGLPNRRAWDDALRQRWAAAAEPAGQTPLRLCLAIFDLDHFKQINDAHGHGVGDQVLRAAARAICAGLRQDDFVARLGGDEFGLLLWVPDATVARAVVDRVRAALPGRLRESEVPTVSASAGYRLIPCEESAAPLPCPDALFAAADTSLREAKRQGRDRTLGQ